MPTEFYKPKKKPKNLAEALKQSQLRKEHILKMISK